MDKEQVTKRLHAIELEAKKLRDIISKPDTVEYDSEKVYIGVDSDDCPYILVGNEQSKRFRFHSFEDGAVNVACIGYSSPIDDAQECIDYHIKNGFSIKAFDNLKEAMEYFISFL